jgi:hypothetical protein
MPSILANGNPRYMTSANIFECKIAWVVTNVSTPGWIVQHISRNEKWTSTFGNSIVAPNSYWECWKAEVNARGEVTRIHPELNNIHDNFSVPGNETVITYADKAVKFPRKHKNQVNNKGTLGKWKIRGRVYWVPEAMFDEKGWKRAMDPETGAVTNTPGAVLGAGRLLSRFPTPVAGDGLKPRGSLGKVLLTRTHAGEWDFTGDPLIHNARDFPDMHTDGFRSKGKTEDASGKPITL